MSGLANLHWIQRLEGMVYEDFPQAQASPGLAIDQATAPYEALDPDTARAMQEMADYIQSTQQGPSESGFQDFLNFGGGILEKLIWPYRQLSTNVLSPLVHMPLVMANPEYARMYQGQSLNDRLYGAWHQADLWAEHDSLGRGLTTWMGIAGDITSISHDKEEGFSWKGGQWLTGGITGKEIYDLQHRQGFGATSGSIDFVSNFFLDPLILLGKVGKATRALKSTAELVSRGDRLTVGTGWWKKSQTPEQIVQRSEVQKFLEDIDGWDAVAIANHPAIKDSANAGQVADLLARATRKDKELIWRIGIGDFHAMQNLQRSAPHIARQYRQLKGDYEFLLNDLKVNPASGEAAVQRYQMRLARLEARVHRFEEQHAAHLALMRTEQMPFTGQFSHDSAVTNSFSVMYREGMVDDPVKLMIPTGAAPRTGPFLLAANREGDEFTKSFTRYLDLQDVRAGFTDVRRSRLNQRQDVAGQVESPAPVIPLRQRELPQQVRRGPESTALPAQLDALGRGELTATGSGWKYTRKGPAFFRFYTLDEVNGTTSYAAFQRSGLHAPEGGPARWRGGDVAPHPTSGESREWLVRRRYKVDGKRVTKRTPGAVRYRGSWVVEERTPRLAGGNQRKLPGMRRSEVEQGGQLLDYPPPGVLGYEQRALDEALPGRPGAPTAADTAASQRLDDVLARRTLNEGGVDNAASQISEQLNLLDDLVGPELARLDATVGFYPAALNAAETAQRARPVGGIFGTLDQAPRGGLYRKWANRSAQRKAQFDARYVRGFRPQNRQSFWDRPAVMIGKVPQWYRDLKTGELTPATMQMDEFESWKTLNNYLKSVRRFDPARRQALVREHMALTNPGEKLIHMEQVEAEIITHMLRELGDISDDTVKQLIEVTLGHRKGLIDRLKGAVDDLAAGNQVGPAGPHGSSTGVYSAAEKEGRRLDLLGDNGEALIATPQFRSQLEREHILLPVDELAKGFWRARHILRGETAGAAVGVANATDLIQRAMPVLSRAWKASVLFRPGYMMRTVSDEMLVAMSVMDGLTYAAGLAESATLAARNVPARIRNASRRYENLSARARGELPTRELEPVRRATGGPVAVATRDGETLYASGFFEGQWADMNRAMTSTNQRAFYGAVGASLDKLRKAAYQGVLRADVDPKSHLAAWTHVLNNTFGKDPLARKALELWAKGLSAQDAATAMRPEAHATLVQDLHRDLVSWLKSPAGQQYSRGNTYGRANVDQWAANVVAIVDHYTVGSDELIGLALSGKVKPEYLDNLVPMNLRPSVHGGEIDWSLMGGTWPEFGNRIMDGMYKLLNQLPTDKLVRHPVADHLYQKRVRELISSARAQGIDVFSNPQVIYMAENAARAHTVKQMRVLFKDHLFNSPPTALRFMMPFFGAWRASMGRWGNLIKEDPSIIQRANQGWQGIHKPYDVINEDGTLVENDDEEAFGLDTKAAIVLRMPKKAVKALGIEYAPAVAVPMKSLNTVLQGDQWYNAGFGPFVTIPVSEVIKHGWFGLDPNDPRAAKWAKPILPYGTQSLTQNLFPSVVRNAAASEEGMDSKAYSTRWINIWRTEVTNKLMGYREDYPGADEISRKANDLSSLHTIAAWLAPFGIKSVYYDKEWEDKYPKEYQFLAGKLRDLKKSATKSLRLPDGSTVQVPDPQEGERQFLTAFPEALAYMKSVNDNKAGIPANMSSWAKSRRVRDLMKTAPDIFAGVAGITDLDQVVFNSDVYTAQRNTVMNAQGETMRMPRSKKELAGFAESIKSERGWRRYGAAMDQIEAELAMRGLYSVEDPGAEDLKDLKRIIAKNIGLEEPEWWQEYNNPDPDRMQRVIEQSREIVKDKRLMTDNNRPDMRALANYLNVRDVVAAELQNRKASGGSADIKADSNQDLLYQWETNRRAATSWAVTFDPIWFRRYFEHDYLADVAKAAYPEGGN